jgi:hypothetical protein
VAIPTFPAQAPGLEKEYAGALAGVEDYVKSFNRSRSYHKTMDKWTEEDAR